MAGNADLLNREFERDLIGRVTVAVEAEPELYSRYRSLRAARWVEIGLKCLGFLFLVPAVFALWSLSKLHGGLSPAVLMAANIAGTFLPLFALAGLWRLLTGPDVMVAMPRLPVPDKKVFERAWAQHSVWAWRFGFVFWLVIYAELIWYGEYWDCWVWVPVFTAVQACLALACCSLVSLVNYLLKEHAIQLHITWLMLVIASVFAIATEEELMLKHALLVEQVNWLLPVHWGTLALVGAETGYLPNAVPFAWLLLASFALHWVCGRIHSRLHPLARLGVRVEVVESADEVAPSTTDDWCLSDEHGVFWSRKGAIEQALWGLATRRERLALEGIANARLSLTLQWGGGFVVVFLCLLAAWVMQLMGSDWRTWRIFPVCCAALAAMIFVCVPPVISRKKMGGNMTVMQNPFPFLPVSAGELYFGLIKATLVKSVFAFAYVVLFVFYIILTRTGFRWDALARQCEFIGVVWIIVTSVGVYVAIAPMLVQSNAFSLKRVQGWITVIAYLFMFGGPLLLLSVLFGVGANKWLFVGVPVVIIWASTHLTLWMWREGVYDFTGIPLVSKGIEQMAPSNFSEAKSID